MDDDSKDDTTTKRPEDEELPTSIIIKDVSTELYEDAELKQNFADMFTQISTDARIDYLKGFRRVRVVFNKPEHATAAKLLVEHHSFNGIKMKAFFAHNIKLIKRAYQDEQGHLKLPPLEKQFLISPPSSPPVGWTQCVEMAPVVCDFDLMARLAAFTVEDDYELHSGNEADGQPAIVVTPAVADAVSNGGESSADGMENLSASDEDADDSNSDIGIAERVEPGSGAGRQRRRRRKINPRDATPTPKKVAMPRTPRPPGDNDAE